MSEGPAAAQVPTSINFIEWYCGTEPVFHEKMQFMLCYFAGFRKEEEQIKNSEAEPRFISFERLALPLPVSEDVLWYRNILKTLKVILGIRRSTPISMMTTGQAVTQPSSL